MNQTKDLISEIYSKKDISELNEYYKEWSTSYDHDVMDRMGYTAPDEAVRHFINYVSDNKVTIIATGLVNSSTNQTQTATFLFF